jgi:hypothetical protein
MSAGDLAVVLVTVLAVGSFVVLVVAAQSLLRTSRELRAALDDLRDEALPLVAELRGTVAEAGAEVERVDELIGTAEAISARVDAASRLGYLAFRAPLIKVMAFLRGIVRFLGRLAGRRSARPTAADRAPAPGVRRAA